MKNSFELIDINRVVDDTLNLVKVQNTAGNTVKIAMIYKRLLEEVGFSVEEYEFITDNPTLIGRFVKGNKDSDCKKIIFNGHMDVITLDHSSPYIEEGKVYGRGTCDMKGSLACILEVVRVLKQVDLEESIEIIVIANSMHESPGGRGEDLLALAKNIKIDADAAIVMEGATHDCTIAQIGSATFNIEISREGSPSHELYTPSHRTHPITVLAEVIISINQANESLKNIEVADIGHGSYFIGNVQSGSFYNQMPKVASVEGVRRYAPSESFVPIEQDFKDLLTTVKDKYDDITINLKLKKVRDGYRLDKQSKVIHSLQKAVKKVRKKDIPLVGKKLVTDAGIFVNELGITTVCHGPDQTQAHAEVEFVNIDELQKTTEVYLQFLHEFQIS